MTDLDVQMKVLSRNIAQNKHILDGNNSTAGTSSDIICHNLNFGDPINELFFETIGWGSSVKCNDLVVVATDVGYDLQLHELFVQSLSSVCALHQSTMDGDEGRGYFKSLKIIIAEEVRWRDIHEWFVDAVKQTLAEFGYEVCLSRLDNLGCGERGGCLIGVKGEATIQYSTSQITMIEIDCGKSE
jgi:hypothetical protein